MVVVYKWACISVRGGASKQAASIPFTDKKRGKSSSVSYAEQATKIMSMPATKIGPYGGPGGNAWDIYTKPKTLVSVQVWSNDCYQGGVINGISFNFVDEAGKSIPSGPWGSKTGEHHMINLIQNERMISISGTTDGKCITSLKFVTDKAEKPYGPYGAQSDEGLSTFSFPATIIAFFGSSSEKLNAIGTYTVEA